MIPKIIHLTWKTSEIPKKYLETTVRSMIIMNPSWTIKLYNDEQCRNLMKTEFPQYLEAYDKLPKTIQRVDFFRVAVVYLYGGFYLDLDVSVIKSFDSLLDSKCVLTVEKIITEEMRQSILKAEGKKFEGEHLTRIGNYAFGAEARFPFLKLWMECIKRNSSKNIADDSDIIDITGPGLLTDIYWMFGKNFDIKLLKNSEGKSEFFGDYAYHHCVGSWRKVSLNDQLVSNTDLSKIDVNLLQLKI